MPPSGFKKKFNPADSKILAQSGPTLFHKKEAPVGMGDGAAFYCMVFVGTALATFLAGPLAPAVVACLAVVMAVSGYLGAKGLWNSAQVLDQEQKQQVLGGSSFVLKAFTTN